MILAGSFSVRIKTVQRTLIIITSHNSDRGLVAGCAGGLAFVAWFLFVSVTVLGKLCPYCMVIWAVTIPVAAATAGEVVLRGHLGLPRPAARGLSTARW